MARLLWIGKNCLLGLTLPMAYCLLIALSMASESGILFYLVLFAGLIGSLPWNIAIFAVFFKLSPDEHFGLNKFFVMLGSVGTTDRGWAELFGFVVTVSVFSLVITGTIVAFGFDSYLKSKRLKDHHGDHCDGTAKSR